MSVRLHLIARVVETDNLRPAHRSVFSGARPLHPMTRSVFQPGPKRSSISSASPLSQPSCLEQAAVSSISCRICRSAAFASNRKPHLSREAGGAENARVVAADGARGASGIKPTARDGARRTRSRHLPAVQQRTPPSMPACNRISHALPKATSSRARRPHPRCAAFSNSSATGCSRFICGWPRSISPSPPTSPPFSSACWPATQPSRWPGRMSAAKCPSLPMPRAAALTQPQYDHLLKLRALASQEAKAQLLRQMMEPVRREDEKTYKAEKASVQREVEKEINATDLYRAIEWMANRRWLDAGNTRTGRRNPFPTRPPSWRATGSPSSKPCRGANIPLYR